MALDFTAIDFETANPSNASACAVGLVKVRGGQVVAQTGWLIQPPAGHDRFEYRNTQIHGIQASDVVGAPMWRQVWARLAEFVGADPLVAHNASFDTSVIRAANTASGAAPYTSQTASLRSPVAWPPPTPSSTPLTSTPRRWRPRLPAHWCLR